MTAVDHIGIAVASLDERLAFYRAIGIEASGVEEVASQKVRVAFLPVDGGRLELLEPTAEDSPIAVHIARRGQGLHHICFRVDDIRATMARLVEAGCTLLNPAPVAGAGGALVCFVHPRSAGGVLVELSQVGR